MRLRFVHLHNFKRFTDLRLDAIPVEAKLILLIGANGSGKSSVFDAFEYASRPQRGLSAAGGMPTVEQRKAYYAKGGADERVELGVEQGSIRLHAGGQLAGVDSLLTDKFTWAQQRLGRFYGRSTLRVTARIIASGVGASSLSEWIGRDYDAPPTFIDDDRRLAADASKYAVDFNQALRQPVFEGKTVDLGALRDSLIEPINQALQRVFGSVGPTPQMINFREPESPSQAIQYFFRKGDHEFAYDVLSFGEKQVFAVLLNLFVRKDKLQDAVIFIDELDLHLNTALQYALLQEIVERWIPDNSQLWTASHSLGFIRYAALASHAAIYDLDALDFDQPQTIVAAPKEDSEVLQVAVPREYLPTLFSGKKLIYCEGQDASKYNSAGLPDTIFVSGGNKFQVFARARDGDMHAVIDRDYLTDMEVRAWMQKQPRLHILPFYSVENLLYHPDNLVEVAEAIGSPFDRAAYITAITQAKLKCLHDLIYGIGKARDGYPFARDLSRDERVAYEQAGREVAALLQSERFEDFYPVFPMKDEARQLPQRQNLAPSKLASTKWFAAQLAALFARVPVFGPSV
jgi:energy-coupling factor transporter ATP-binding protein EcfA2